MVLAGVLGYTVLEGWSLFDAFYMTVITLATIGYGEVRPLTVTGRIFTIGLILAGVTAGAYIAGTFTQLAIEERLQELLGRRRMERDLKRLRNHYIICGWGRIGREIASEFRRKRVPFVVVELDPVKCAELHEDGILHVQGDASEDDRLREAGVERALGLVAVAPRDADNIFITLSARALNKSLFIVARSIYEADAHKLEIAGANRVISPYVIGARRIAAAVFHPTVVDFLDLEVHHGEVEWELEEVGVSGHSQFAGKTLRDSGIREHSGCTVLAVREGASGRFVSNPAPETLLREGDTLVVLGLPEQLARLEALAGLPAEESHPRTRRRPRGLV